MGRIVDAANRAITRVNVEAPTTRQHRRSLDLDAELDRLEQAGRSEVLERDEPERTTF
jgi:hypothetical protein